ncbi:MAG: prepilin-type N-terminal cleavage/methylation domain-containing protein [Rhodocyclaceae bacterium]|jgi:prepilin-type N-terminal cleavage/methylation domain-containing protein|nr:prepilin-type N-terminal cleavage/methylation domain-containing protein [Rhodocyclaceae bacterium]
MKERQSGFTLVEIAIVLVIIGLLLGGVLKGQELINSAKVKNFAQDFRNIPLFIYGYQDKYRALPGDDANVAAHLGASAQPGAGGTLGNGVIEGDWFSTDRSANAPESVVFWQHVRLANLASGPTNLADPSYFPTNADGGRIGIESGSATPAQQYISGLTGTFIVCSSGILGKFALQLDTTMDDGNPFTGSMRAIPGAPTTRQNTAHCAVAGTPAACTTAVDPAAAYTVCMSL